ncbi:MAG: class B sortase [Clostridiaceae bacterium]
MKRKKRTKADIITSVLYVIFGLMVAAVLYGLGSLGYVLLGAQVGNSYYAKLAEETRTEDTVNFSALSAENPEIKAWVRLDGTAIDLPIVQTTDNSFYLTHRFDEKKNKLGTPFIDAANAGDFSDRHTVIYGHAVSSGAMFGSFWEYENPNYFNRNPELTLYLPDGTQYILKVFACARVDGVRSSIPVSFAGDSAFLAFVEGLEATSAFTSNVNVGADDRIVSFCVCLADDDTRRLLVSCKLSTPGEATTLADGTSITIGDTATQP